MVNVVVAKFEDNSLLLIKKAAMELIYGPALQNFLAARLKAGGSQMFKRSQTS